MGAAAAVLTLLLAGAPAALGGQELGAGAYLFRYQPVDVEGVEGRTELYAAFLHARHRSGPWELYAEVRARDDRLRPFYPGNVWFQEVWAAYHLPRDGASSLRLRAGKTYQTAGRFWDGSFFGNLHYFDGLKLNPQWLVEAAGTWEANDVELGYEAQYVTNSDRVSGALSGRDFETLDGVRDQHGLAARATVALAAGLRLGGTVFSRGVRLDPDAGSGDGPRGTDRILHVGADVELRRGELTAYGEWLHRGDGDLPDGVRPTIAGSEAGYLLLGGQWSRGRLHLRYNASRASYDALDRVEWIHQPGVTHDFSDHVSGLAELNLWSGDDRGGAGSETVDRSLNLVLLVTF